MLTACSAALLACGLSALMTGLLVSLSPRLGLVDHPDGKRKLQARAVPAVGGIAIALAASAAWVVVAGLPPAGPGAWIASGIAFLVLVGIVDDRLGLSGRQKLLGQMVALLVVTVGTPNLDALALGPWAWQLGPLAGPATFLALLVAVNAFNLIDGLDGLATSLAIIGLSGLAVVAASSGRAGELLAALVLLSALAGFLPFNRPGARAYLGDAGSMPLGLVLGLLTLRLWTSPTASAGIATTDIAGPLVLWTLPLFDCGMAIVRRIMAGRSLFQGDRGHVHHRFQQRFGTPRALGLLVTAMAFVTTSGVLGLQLRTAFLGPAASVVLLAVFVGVGRFGRHELGLLGQRGASLARSFLQLRTRPTPRFRPLGSRGAGEWQLLWDAMVEVAEAQKFVRVRLDVDVPALSTGCHAEWERGDEPSREDEAWRIRLPLLAAGRPIGHLEAVAPRLASLRIDRQGASLLEYFQWCEQHVTGTLNAVAVLGRDSVASPTAGRATEPAFASAGAA